MKNHVQSGEVITLVAGGTITPGLPVKAGNLFGFALGAAATGANFELARRGVFTTTVATSGESWAVGDLIYWSGTAFRKTPSAGDLLVGFAPIAKGSGTTQGTVLLDGTARAVQA